MVMSVLFCVITRNNTVHSIFITVSLLLATRGALSHSGPYTHLLTSLNNTTEFKLDIHPTLPGDDSRTIYYYQENGGGEL